MNPPSLSQRGAYVCLLALAAAMPLVPILPGAPMAKQLLFAGLAVLGTAFLWAESLRGRLLPTLGTPTDIAFFGFLAATLPSLVLAENPPMARLEMGRYVCLALTFALAVKTLRSPRQVAGLLAVVLAGGVVISALGLEAYQRFLADDVPEVARSGYLATSLFRHSYLAAQYLVMVFVGGLVVLLERGVSLRARVAVGVALAPIGLYLLAIGSRGGYLAVVFSLLVSTSLRASGGSAGRRLAQLARGLLKLGLVLFATLLLYIVASLVGLVPDDAMVHAFERLLLFFDPKSSDNSFERLDIWATTLSMVSDHLLTGVGLGSYASSVLPYQTVSRVVPHAHNQFLQVLAQSGLVGLVGLAFLVKVVTHTARRATHHLAEDLQRRALFQATVAALTAALVYFFLETPLHLIEAGSLIVILLAVMSRAGCESRDAVTAPAMAHAGLALPLLLLGLALPGWLAFQGLASVRVEAYEVGLEAREVEATSGAAAARDLWARNEELFHEADARFPHTLEVIAPAVSQEWARGALRKALAWQQLGIERAPGAPFQLFDLGALYLALDRPHHAVGPLREASLRLADERAEPTRAELGRAFGQLERFEEAWIVQRGLVQDETFLEEDPTVLLDAVGTLLMLQRELVTADALLERFAELAPEGREDVRYVALRARLEKQRAVRQRPLWRAPAWAGWIDRLPGP